METDEHVLNRMSGSTANDANVNANVTIRNRWFSTTPRHLLRTQNAASIAKLPELFRRSS